MSESRHQPTAPTGTHDVAAGTGIDAHRHDEHQLLYPSQGVLSVVTDASVWITSAHRALWVPAGVIHRHRAYGSTVVHTVGLPATARPLPTVSPAVVMVSPLLRELVIAYTSAGGDGPPRRRLRAVLLDELRASPEQPLRLPVPRDPRLVELAHHFEHHPADHRPIGQLASAIGTSERTLSRLCRDELAMTFPQWRTQLRLHRALQLLAQRTPVTAVAHRCGWATPSAFVEAFRKTMGHTPGTHGPRPTRQ